LLLIKDDKCVTHVLPTSYRILSMTEIFIVIEIIYGAHARTFRSYPQSLCRENFQQPKITILQYNNFL